jgi:1-acyl-sn-glycerol-3-phosphate acyltransferase
MSRRSHPKRLFYDATKQFFRVFFASFFRVRCTARENWPAEGAALVCSNHQSYFDPALIGLSCDRHLNYLARRTLFAFAPFRWLIGALDAIPIEREGIGIGGVKETIRRLRRGEMVVLFPEGTRSRTGELSAIKPGFCALARRADVEIVPIGIDGAFQAWPKGRRLPGLGTVHICVGDPIRAHEVTALTDEELVLAVTERIQACLKSARASRQTAIGRPTCVAEDGLARAC